MQEQKLFSIGDVARMFHLSVSSLRHYETLGLLQPERIDPVSNYRYYSVRQFEVLNTIRYLRALDMPLREMRIFCKTATSTASNRSCASKNRPSRPKSTICSGFPAKLTTACSSSPTPAAPSMTL